MSVDLGIVRPGRTIYIPFATYDSNDPSASVTTSGLAVTDIEVYKDGGTTQRASDSGYALLDTDGIDFDGTTGIHGFSIDLSNNTTANFYEAGSSYWVIVASITVDAATINFIAAKFEIGYPDAVLNTTVASLASQTSFTLEEGPADNDALNGFGVIVHDLASSIQIAHGIVSDYTGSSKTVTLRADPGIFTMAAGDNVSFFVPTITPATQASIDAIEVDTGTTLDGKINTIDGIVDAILVDTGTTLEGKIDTIDGIVDSILVDTGTTLDTKLNDIQGGSFSSGTDSLESIRNRGDAEWVSGGGSDRLLMVDTTIATLASQVSFTLSAGSADNNAYLNCTAVIEDASTAAQKAIGLISAYTGSSKTVTLKYDPGVFTMAATDKIYILAENALKSTAQNRQLDVTATGEAGLDLDNVAGALGTSQFDAGFLTASLIAADAIGSSELATTAVEEIRNAVTGGAYDLDTDSNGRIRIVDGTGAGELDTSSGLVQLLAATQASIDAILVDTGTTIPATLSTIDGIVDSILVDTGTTLDDKLDTIDGIVDAILLDTGTTLNNKIDVIDGIVDSILVDTGTTLDGKINTIDGIVDSILVDTAEIGTAGAGLTAIMTTAMTESYNADGAAPTPAQALHVIMQGVTEFAIASTTKTVKKLDGSTTAYTETLNSATAPTSITRAT